MTVLYIVDPGIVGGATRSFQELVVALKQMGVTPIVCTSDHSELNVYLEAHDIQTIAIHHRSVMTQLTDNSFKRPLSYIKHVVEYRTHLHQALYALKKNIDFSTIDLIHTNSARNDVGCHLSKMYGIPHIMHIREFGDLDFGCISLNPNWVKLYNRYTTKYITISDAIKTHWSGKGFDAGKMVTIYNGIHYQNITHSDDAAKRDGLIKMVIVGGVYPTKGQHLAVEAICSLDPVIRDHLTLDIIGWGSDTYIQEMKDTARRCGCEDKLRFLGARDDVHVLLGNYQIGLMCSRAEGFGRTTAEYMHAQLGVIASNSGAGPELIDDGVNGLLFNSCDSENLAKCMMKYINDRDLLIRCSHAAREKAMVTYTDNINAYNIHHLYLDVLKEKAI